MNNSIRLVYNVDVMWDTVKKIRQQVNDMLAEKSEEIRYASKMTASELIENAIKFGLTGGDQNGIEFELNLVAGTISVQVSNQIINHEDYQTLKTIIEQIRDCEDPQQLYVARLMELMENPKPAKAQLGLYRIAYEGQFKLDYALTGDMLTITATRHT